MANAILLREKVLMQVTMK